MKILAIDFGDKRIGFAIGLEESGMAFPLPAVRRTDDRSLLGHIRRIMGEHEVGKIVVGYPLHADGASSRTCEKVDRFIGIIEKRLGVTIERVDEHLTSWEAEQDLKAAGKNARERRQLADSFAAAAIARTYFGRK